MASMVAGALFGHATILTQFFVALVEFVAAVFVLRAARKVDPAWIVCIALVTSPLQAHELHIPISPHRILLPAALIVLALRMPGARNRANFEFRPVHAILALASAYVVISAIATGTLTGTEPFYTMMDRFGLLSFALYFVGPVLFRTSRQQGILIAFMIGLGAYLGILALLETAHAWGIVWPRYIADPGFGDNFGRARGPFVEAQANGLAMFMCGVFAALGFARWRGWRRVLSGGVAALLGLGVVLTLTRGAWVGAGAGVVVTMLLFRQLRPYIVPVGLACIIGIGGALVVSPTVRKKVFNRAATSSTVNTRKSQDTAAIRMFETRPLLGFGWASFKKKSAPYYRDGSTYSITGTGEDVPNVFLSNAAELGLVGGGLWLLGVLVAFGGAIFGRGPPELVPWRMAACAMGVAWLIVSAFSVTDFTFPCFVAWLVAGIARGTDARRRELAEAEAAETAEAEGTPPDAADAPTTPLPDWGFDEPEPATVRALDIAFLTTVLPEGRSTGGEVVSQAFIDALRGAGHRVRVVGYVRPGGTVSDPDALSAGARPIETSGASLRDRGAWAGAAMRRQLPFSVAKYVSPAYAARAHALLTDPEVDLVVLDHAQSGWLEPDVRRSGKPVVFLAHNVESDLYQGRAGNGGGWSGSRRIFEREARLIGEVERSLVALAVDVWTVAPDDAARLGPRARVFAVPGGIDVSGNGSGPDAAFDVGLIGSWTWGPNADGLRWFVDRVLPLLPSHASVHLAGRGAEEVTGSRPGIILRGFVPDAAAFAARARVLAVPAVAGAGVQVKTLDAIAAGGWVVATPLALRGIESPPSTVGIAQEPEDFAAQITAGLVIAPAHEARAGALMWAQARRDAFRAAVVDAADRAAGEAPTDPETDAVTA